MFQKWGVCALRFHFVYFIFLIISYLLISIVIIIVWLSIFSLQNIKEGNYKMKEEYIVRKNSRYFEDLENNSYQQQKNRTSGFYWKKKKKREKQTISKKTKRKKALTTIVIVICDWHIFYFNFNFWVFEDFLFFG